jgi:hypothetical protein
MTLQASEAGTPWQLVQFEELPPKELPKRVEASPFKTRSYAEERAGGGALVTATRFFWIVGVGVGAVGVDKAI